MSFITGKYSHRIRSWAIGVPLDPAEMTWARRAAQAGVRSTMIGKMDFCGEYQDGGFSEHFILRRRRAFNSIPLIDPYEPRLAGYRKTELRSSIDRAGSRTDEVISDGNLSDESRFDVGNYDHDRIVTDRAIEYLRGRKDADERWLLYVGYLFPHYPFVVPERFFEYYHPDKVEMPVDFRVPNPDLHPAVRAFQETLCLDGMSTDTFRRAIAAYYGMITCLDEMIGEILTELDRQGLAESTTVIYTSDHGESLGEHGLINKQCPYRGSVGVPLVLAGPGIAQATVHTPVSLIDLYPTIMELCGVETETDRPGHSLLSFADGRRNRHAGTVFAEFQSIGFRHDWYMIANDRYKYTHFVGDSPLLFDLEDDPCELKNVAGESEYTAVVGELEAQLRSIVDPERISREAKRDLGLITEDGVDLTLTPPECL